VIALASGTLDPGRCSLVVAHQGSGFSVWSVPVEHRSDGALAVSRPAVP
jgi:hypothetical protein